LRTGRPHGWPVRRCTRWGAGGYAAWFAASGVQQGWTRAGTAPSRRSCESSRSGRGRPPAQGKLCTAPGPRAGRSCWPGVAECAGRAGSRRSAPGFPAVGRRRAPSPGGTGADRSSRRAKAFAQAHARRSRAGRWEIKKANICSDCRYGFGQNRCTCCEGARTQGKEGASGASVRASCSARIVLRADRAPREGLSRSSTEAGSCARCGTSRTAASQSPPCRRCERWPPGHGDDG
jgi:hypothetical protein